MVLIKDDGHKIRETNYMMFQHEYDRSSVQHENIVWLDRSFDYVLGCNRGFANYYHWTTQALPAIDWSLRNMNGTNLRLALPSLAAWQEETLRLLGHGEFPRVRLEPYKSYYVPRLHYSDFLYGATAFGVSVAANDTYFRLRDAALHADPLPADEVIYVARSDSAQRSIQNEAELIAALASEGVRIVVPGQRSVQDQVNIFNRAAIVIGAHGAGLTNVVFCRPRAILYELMPGFYTNPCYRRLAQAGGLTYYADIFDADGDVEAFVHNRPWRCDIAMVLQRLRQCRQDMSEGYAAR
jgi:capsular polysaccharide biosynthesis protein